MTSLVAEFTRKPRRQKGNAGVEERQALDPLRKDGRLQRRARSLEEFFRFRRHELLQRVGDAPDSRRLLKAAQQMILEYGAIDPLAEAIDQIQEMERVLQAVDTSIRPDPNAVAGEWAELHAAGWRQRLITEYLHVAVLMVERGLLR